MSSIGSSVRLSDLAGIQYVGNGYSRSCLDSVRRLIQYRETIDRVDILTCDGSHGLLLHIEREGIIAVKAGFASGYAGEGPRTLAAVLELFEALYAPIEEREVSVDVMKRLEGSALTRHDIETIANTQPVLPRRWHEYVRPYWTGHDAARQPLTALDVVMPWALIDPRLMDLARTFFDDPDDAILKGFRRLEDIIRERTGSSEHGKRLFAQAFLGDASALWWNVADTGEQAGRGQLFVGTFMAYRNPRAHREDSSTAYAAPLREFLMLNELFHLEAEAVKRR
jgi:uncharacterized protein (TIGR02391 family)